MADHEGGPALLQGVTRKSLVVVVGALVLVGCLGGLAGAEAILLVSAAQRSSPVVGGGSTGSTTGQSTSTVSTGATPLSTAPPSSGGGPSPTSTPQPTFPPATPQPALYSVSLASKVFGTSKPDVGMNIQVWPPDRNVSLRVTYSVCSAEAPQTSVIVPSWSDYGVGETDLSVGSCWQQGSTIQLDITAYWSGGQTGHLQTTAPVNW